MSKEEQGKRFLERLDTPEKHWKFSEADLQERSFWPQYQDAFEEMLDATSTRAAPWWVIPADNKWITRALVSAIITDAIRGLGLEPPQLDAERTKRLDAARRQLEAEMPKRARQSKGDDAAGDRRRQSAGKG